MSDSSGSFAPQGYGGGPSSSAPPPQQPPGPASSTPAKTGAGNKSLLLALAAATLLAGLLCVVTPFGNWMKISFGGLDASVNGYGMESSDFEEDDDSSSSEGFTESSDESGDDALSWLASPIPDGVPITALGLLIGAVSLVLLLRVMSPPPDAERSRREILTATAVIAGAGVMGFLWTAMSWFNLNKQWEDALSESLEDDELGFGAMFAAGIDFEPGYGLILSGLAMAGIAAAAAAAFVVSFSRMEKMPIAVTFTTAGPTGAAQGPPAGQWSPTPPPQSGPPSGQWTPTPPPQSGPPPHPGPPSGP